MSVIESFQIPGPTNLGEFVNCLKNKDVTFYGASWCEHCQAQKRLFGSAADQLQYVECAAPDGRYVNDTCVAKDLTEFPTWELADGSRLVGEQSLQTIAQKTGCQLPSGQ
jgi:glutaredoxin